MKGKKKLFYLILVNALQIRNLLVQIGNELHCPVCQLKLSSTHLKIEGTKHEGCEIAISCPSCRDEYRGLAHMVPMLTSHGKTLNASSILTKDQEVSKGIDSKECENIHNSLEGNISFTTLFAEKKNK